MARPLLCHTPIVVVVVGRNGSSFDIPNPTGFTPVNPTPHPFVLSSFIGKHFWGPIKR